MLPGPKLWGQSSRSGRRPQMQQTKPGKWWSTTRMETLWRRLDVFASGSRPFKWCNSNRKRNSQLAEANTSPDGSNSYNKTMLTSPPSVLLLSVLYSDLDLLIHQINICSLDQSRLSRIGSNNRSTTSSLTVIIPLSSKALKIVPD